MEGRRIRRPERVRAPAPTLSRTPKPAPGGHSLVSLQRSAGNRAVAALLARVSPQQTQARAAQIYQGSGTGPLAPGSPQELANWHQAEAELRDVEQRAAARPGGDAVANYLAAEKDVYLEKVRVAYLTPANFSPDWDSGSLRCLYDYRTRLAPLVNNLNELRDLGAYIDEARFGGQARYQDRAEVLLTHNRLFNRADRRVRCTFGDFDVYGRMLTAFEGLRPADSAAIRALGPDVVLAKLMRANDMSVALELLAAAYLTGGVMGSVNAGTITALERVYRHCPSGRFRGFRGWGAGNHGTVEGNMFEHFAKHVLNDFEPGQTRPPAQEQAQWWWGLNLRVTLSEVVAPAVIDAKLLGIFTDDLVGAFGPNWQANAANIPIDARSPGGLAVLSKMSRRIPSVARRLYDLLGGRYTSGALAWSKNMSMVQVHLSQNDYFVSGFYGRVYIVGRVEANGPTISSAYWVPDPQTKFDAATENRLWRIE